MKRIIIIGALLISAGAVTAQNSSLREINNSRGVIRQDNEYAVTEMSLTDNKIVIFSDLPNLKKGTWAVVTDANGEILSQKRIDPINNAIDVHRLPKGELYYVTLLYKNKSQKAFVLHL